MKHGFEFRGEVIFADAAGVVCWVQISPQWRIRTRFPRVAFEGIPLIPAAEFRWNSETDEIRPLKGPDPEVMAAIARLEREWEENLRQLWPP